MMLATKWTLAEGISLVRALQPKAKVFSYHITLGGSVLNKGSSEKDLDLYFLPLEGKGFDPNPDKLKGWLDEIWGTGVDLSRKPNVSRDPMLGDGILRNTRYGIDWTPTNPNLTRIPITFLMENNIQLNTHSLTVNPWLWNAENRVWEREGIQNVDPPQPLEYENSTIFTHKLKYNYEGLRIDVFIH